MPRVLRVTPVGGLGEVGRNMTLVDWGQERIVVDCGVGFPRGRDRAGPVEQLLPDVRVASDRPIAAVFLTHGHDDHVAALAHLIRGGAPIGRIVGLPFTIALVRAKLSEADVPLPPLVAAVPGQLVTTGAYAVEFVRVAHSIPDAAALAIGTPIGTIVFTGDYKLDDTLPNPRRRTDKTRFAALGRAGVLAMFGDSTNAPRAGRTPSETTVAQPLADVVGAAPGRVVLTCFASHIDRVDHAFRAADMAGRAVSLLGRSMRRNVDIAEQMGELRRPARPTVSAPKLAGERPRGSMVVCTGSQAEEFAVLARAARGQHPHLMVGGRDTIVFATRPVPGNEEAVAAMQRDLRVRGATIITHEDAPIHVSGHGSADEVAELVELVRPRFLVPVHGDDDMLEAQGRLGVARAGMDRADVLLAQNGDVVEIGAEHASIVEHVAAEVVQADADGLPLEPR